MKKAFTAIAVLALTIGAASALSFSWGTKTQISFNGTQLTTAELAAPVTVELIYLGTDKAWSFDVGDSFADGSPFGNGNVFGIMITYTDTEGNVWYNLSSNTYTLSGADRVDSVINKQFFDFAWENDESGGDTPTAGGGWWMVPVPEPMTVLCGLAGLALLLKRRA